MGLFNLLKAKDNAPQVITFVQANNFKGFKKLHVVVYGDEESEANNELLKDIDMKGKTISFKEERNGNEPFWTVYIEDKKVGAIFDKDQVDNIKSDNIESVYIKFESQNVTDGKNIITRPRLRMFIKNKS